MATPDLPRSASVDPPTPPETSVLRVREPGELIAAVPVLLGFHPRRSLVLIATGGASGRRLGLTLRVDLPSPQHAASVGAEAVQSLLLDAPTGAAVMVVADSAGTGPPHSELVDLVVHALETHAVDVHTVLWTEGTTAGARWACYDPCGCVGVAPDSSATPFAAAAVAGGRVVRGDREELEQLVAPADAERIRRREVLLIRAVDEALDRPEPDIEGDPAIDTAAIDTAALDIATIDTAIVDAGAGRLVLDDARVLALAAALAVPAVRDTALLRCVAPAPVAAEQLWTALVRETPDPEAAEPAVLLAVSAMLRGDGALANVALDRAEQAWPGHRLAGILRPVLLGMRPEEIRALLRGRVQLDPGTGPIPRRRRTVRRNRRSA
jgi:hypothetical protein